MKKLYSDPNLTHCDVLKALLEASGIECELRNEYASRTTGAGFGFSLPFAWPELWVVRDEQVEQAVDILRAAEEGGEGRSS